MGQGTTEPTGRPHRQQIELASDGGLQHGIELRALIASFRAADAVILVELDDLVPGTFAPVAQLSLLVDGELIVAADPDADHDVAFHRELIGGRQKVRPLEIAVVRILGIDETRQIERLLAFQLDGIDLIRLQDDVGVFAGFIAFDDIISRRGARVMGC